MIRVWRGVLFRLMPSNDIGNRPAAPMVTEDQGMNRRVRMTVRLGPTVYGLEEKELVIADVEILDVSTGHKAALFE
jgi:hypothetical protein